MRCRTLDTFSLASLVFGIVFYLYYLNEGFVYYDEGMILNYSSRILKGEVPYRDFFMQVTPGSSYLYGLALSLYNNAIAPRTFVFFEFIISLYFSIKILRILKLESLLWIAILYLSSFSFIHWNFPYYSWDAAVFYFPVLYLLLKGYQGKSGAGIVEISLCGVLSFASFIFKQNIGIFLFGAVGFVILFFGDIDFKSRFRSISVFILAFFIPVLLFFIYYSIKGISYLELIQTLFFSGAKNKGGLKSIVNNLLPSSMFIFWVTFFLGIISIFYKRFRERVYFFILLTFSFLVLLTPKEEILFRLYDLLFAMGLVRVLSLPFGRKVDSSVFDIYWVLSFFLIVSSTMVGPQFGRKIVSLLLGGVFFFPVALGYIRKVNHKLFIIFLLIFFAQGFLLKKENFVFRRLSSPFSKDHIYFNTPKLSSLKSSLKNVRIVDGVYSFLSHELREGDRLFVFYGAPVFYYLLNKGNISKYDFFWWDITSDEVVADALRNVFGEGRDPDYVLVVSKLDFGGDFYNKYVETRLVPSIYKYLESYKEVFNVGSISIYKKSDDGKVR